LSTQYPWFESQLVLCLNETPHGLIGWETACQLGIPGSSLGSYFFFNETPHGLIGWETARQLNIPGSSLSSCYVWMRRPMAYLDERLLVKSISRVRVSALIFFQWDPHGLVGCENYLSTWCPGFESRPLIIFFSFYFFSIIYGLIYFPWRLSNLTDIILMIYISSGIDDNWILVWHLYFSRLEITNYI
jgi:hypothetical protein